MQYQDVILKLTTGFGRIFVCYKEHGVVQVCYGAEPKYVSDQ